MAHRLETRIEYVLAQPPVDVAAVEALQALGDALSHTFEALQSRNPRTDVGAPSGDAVAVDADARRAAGRRAAGCRVVTGHRPG